ncbi:MAG: DNA/RNA nuclease SfsA [Thermodesulfobacteriota bacterium]
MKFSSPLQEATLLKRYKRFLADVKTDDGIEFTVHCPNSGSMLGCSTPGSRVLLSESDNPKRKYRHTLEMVQGENGWIGVNTSLTNKLVAEALEERRIRELRRFDSLRREVKTSDKSRLDLLLMDGDKKIYIEIKNCSLAENGCAMFPDSVTARGTKHLLELADLVKQGHRGIIFFCVQRTDADRFQPAAHIDPLYASTLAEVQAKGVETLVYQAHMSPEEIIVDTPLPFATPSQEPGNG